jgi:uncharacterized protein YegP (UPF0339 family)
MKGHIVAHFEIFQDTQNYFRWRFQANNGTILARYEESFINKLNCEHAILLLKQQAPKAAINLELTSKKRRDS